jgi:hypothetical protein
MWDLKDMFHQIQVHKSMRRMLRASGATAYSHGGFESVEEDGGENRETRQDDTRGRQDNVADTKHYTVSQGLSPSPGIATKMMSDVLRLIRKCGVRVAIKVDDIICTATGLQEAMRAGYIISLLLTKLGAIFSPKNSLYPCVQVDWCGARICSVAGVTMQLPEKVTNMVSRAAQLREQLLNDGATIWARALMEVKEVLMAALDQVDAVRILCVEIHLLQRWLESLSEGDLDMRHQVANVPIDMRMRVIEECNTWCKDYNADNPVSIHWNGKIHVLEAPKAVIWSDACNFQMGWRVEQDKKRGHEP